MNLAGPRIRPAALAVGLLAIAAAAPAIAGQIELKNDSIVNFSQIAIQSGFDPGEHGAAWLTSSCDGDVIAVRILWLSSIGNTPPVLGEAIRISQAGTFPIPGTLLQELLGPQMIDGGFNEFTLVPSIPISNGQTIVVDFVFLEDPQQGVGPSLVTDTDGCQPGLNGLLAIPPGAWFDSCVFMLSGDFAIRAVVDCADVAIFADGFESGDTSAWSSTVP